MKLHRTTKLIRTTFFLIFCCFNTFAYTQEDTTAFDLGAELNKIFSTQVEMDVDLSLYPQQMGNFYISEDPVGILLAMVVPQSFEKAKGDMTDSKDGFGEGSKIKEQGSFIKNGREIAFAKGIAKKDGKKLWMEMYTIQVDENRSLMVLGTCDIKSKNRFTSSFLKAAETAKVSETKEGE
jgi:hypothetical protein